MNRQEAESLVAALQEALIDGVKVQLVMTALGEVVSIPLLNGEICDEGLFMDI